MTTTTLPEPKYQVTASHTRDGHFYEVTYGSFKEIYPGTTGFLSIIGGEKTNRLMGWAKKESLLVYQNALTGLLMGKKEADVFMSLKLIEDIRKSAWKRPETIKNEAGDIGTRIHAYIDASIKKTELPPLTDDIKPAVDNFFSWLKQAGIEIVCGDIKVANIKEGYAGAIDAIGLEDRKFGILDWKSGKYLHNEAALQAGGAYAKAFECTYGIKIEWADVIRFDKVKNEFEHKSVKSLTRSYKAFLAAKELFELMSQDHFK